MADGLADHRADIAQLGGQRDGDHPYLQAFVTSVADRAPFTGIAVTIAFVGGRASTVDGGGEQAITVQTTIGISVGGHAGDVQLRYRRWKTERQRGNFHSPVCDAFPLSVGAIGSGAATTTAHVHFATAGVVTEAAEVAAFDGGWVVVIFVVAVSNAVADAACAKVVNGHVSAGRAGLEEGVVLEAAAVEHRI